MNIPDEFQKICIGVQEQRLVSSLEYMPCPGLCKVDPFGIAEREILHDFRKGNIAGLYDDMDMVCHAAKAVDAAGELLHGVLQKEIETVIVAVVEKDRLTSVAAEYDMINSAREMNAWFACHGKIIHENSRKSSLTP